MKIQSVVVDRDMAFVIPDDGQEHEDFVAGELVLEDGLTFEEFTKEENISALEGEVCFYTKAPCNMLARRIKTVVAFESEYDYKGYVALGDASLFVFCNSFEELTKNESWRVEHGLDEDDDDG